MDTMPAATIAAPTGLNLSPVPPEPPSQPTPDSARPDENLGVSEHTVQPGDTLLQIAQRYNTTLDTLMSVNALTNPDMLSVGQVIVLPSEATTLTPDFKLIPDVRLVRGPGSSAFDIAHFVNQQPGYIRQATDTVTTRLDDGAALDEVLSAAQIVQRVSLEYSVDARLLLILLEFQAGWLSNPFPEPDKVLYPLLPQDRAPGYDVSGLYNQLSWAANTLNRGYYGWKYRGLNTIEFVDGLRARFASGLNAGTIGLQVLFSALAPYDSWTSIVSFPGFYATYYAYFGDPFAGSDALLIPENLTQPVLELPFKPGETWYYTGGPHGGWGSGSAWASLDFAPPDARAAGTPLCYTAQAEVTAVAAGVIARIDPGIIILDLDLDGDESTGWTILYLHVSPYGSLQSGQSVSSGMPLGNPSCAGGVSSATHLHIARRYNGEWMPADCQACTADGFVPPFILGEWQAVGLAGQHYQGFLERNGVRQYAEQGRDNPINHISW